MQEQNARQLKATSFPNEPEQRYISEFGSASQQAAIGYENNGDDSVGAAYSGHHMPQYRAAREVFKNPEVVSSNLTEDPPSIGVDGTEDGIAQELVRKRGSTLRYDHTSQTWYKWSGSVWEKDQTKEVREYLRVLAREAAKRRDGRERASVLKASFISGAERLATSDASVSVISDHWDQNPLLLGCPTVTVDLRSGRYLRPNPEHGITKQCGADPQDGACPNWLKFLSDATGEDEDVIAFLQVWFGYLLTGLTNEQTLLFIHGPGGNGKSVLLNVIRRILGQYNTTAAIDTFARSNFGQHPTDLAMLRGARSVIVTETEEGQSWAAARIKLLTGGDEVTARFMRQDFFTFRPTFKLTIVGNHPPSLSDVDPAMRRRFLILEFSRQPRVVDHDLEAKLFAEAPQILAWAIRGCLEYLERGLPRPEAVLAATKQYFEEQDTFNQWLEESCVLGQTGSFTASASLYASWRQYSENAGEIPGSQKQLAQKLKRNGLYSGQKRLVSGNCKGWHGISLSAGSSG